MLGDSLFRPLVVLGSLVFASCGFFEDSSTPADPFFDAIGTCDTKAVEAHIQDGRSPFERGDSGASTLANALGADAGFSSGFGGFDSVDDCREVIQFFLDAGVNPTELDSSGSGPPIWVIRGDLPPDVLDALDPSIGNWCSIGERRGFESVIGFAVDDDDWDSAAIDQYLSQCR